MQTKLLIDAIVGQTTVLIASLSTAAGIRAPLAHVADQVFLELARTLEAQGVGRKVVADMFGLALRGYQKKIQRLEESVTMRDETLWEALLGHIRKHQGIHRREVLHRFEKDDEESVGAVLRDLVSSGLVFMTGQGDNAVYRATSEDDLKSLVDADSAESLKAMAWALVYHFPGIRPAALADRLGVSEVAVASAISVLEEEGRIVRDAVDPEMLSAKSLLVPVGASAGWEAAVFDHFRAMASAISAKLRAGSMKSEHGDVMGGATLHFEISRGHPLEAEVLDLLNSTRTRVNDLWERVCAHNAQHPLTEDSRLTVCFYFGQNVLGDAKGDDQ
ncbi:MAG: hypothetical protein SFV15_15080 [Polyangiaceae bacterium]|nr:hypothetical protein [Polyangiaceae bacterium]